MKKKLALLVVSCGLLFGSFGQQDQHFSMFTESPVYINPATAGFTPGDLQLFTNYRLQWSTVSDNPYRTISASADWQMFDNGGSFLGAGLNFYNDVAGVSNYQTNVIALPVNYALQVDRNNFISFGLQPAFYQRNIKNPELNWFNQWNGVAYDQSINSNEVILTQNFNVSRFDIAAGVYWEGFLNPDSRIKLGLSGQHLTRQRINFTSEDTRLYRKLNLHGQLELKNPTTGITILPAFAAFLQGPNSEVVLGSNFRFLLKGASRSTSYFDEITLSLGAYFRVRDAILVNVIFDAGGFSFGAGYDLNVTDLTVASKGVGAMEFFIKYRIQFGTRNLRNNRVH